MYHARYFEPKARFLRSCFKAHFVPCEGCGKTRCCFYSQFDDEPFHPCPWMGEWCEGARDSEGRILCGMCY